MEILDSETTITEHTTERLSKYNIVTADLRYVVKDIFNSSTNVSQHNEAKFSTVFGAFIFFEIVMTATELLLSTVAALKISRWRNNFRNQMLMQLSFARFVKRIIFFIEFLKERSGTEPSATIKTILTGFQIYIDFVIVILVCFFIKHMYDSLIVVIVKISKGYFYGVLCCSWLLPIPISLIWTGVIVSHLLKEWTAYFTICLVFRWPIIFLGTALYLTVLYKVMKEKIRRFARSLTIVTFLLCLDINFYLFSKDIIKLWCSASFTTIFISYISGLILNILMLSFYVILILLNFKSTSKSCNTLPDFSTADVIK